MESTVSGKKHSGCRKCSGGFVAALMVSASVITAVASPAGAMPSSQKLAKLTSDVTIVVGSDQKEAVQIAARDLASDLKKVFGKEAKIVERWDGDASTVIFVGDAGDEASSVAQGGPESFTLAGSSEVHDGKPIEVIRLAGADMRGTIYAIYQFSQDYLGVDPMYLWTGNEPAHRTEIPLPATFMTHFAPPVFKYRGVFINDEDLLTGWSPGEKDGTGISLQAWNQIYETLLRLKANMVAPGSWIFPNEPEQQLASRRGLVLSIHHATPLNVNVARWPKGVPYNYTTHPEILERAWTNAVKAFPKDQEILWEVGLRGMTDESYGQLDPSIVGNPVAEGALISKAVNKQMQIVRAFHPDAKFVTNLWSEGAGLMDKGYLTLPPEVITAWPDTGYGTIQDRGKVKAGQGAYVHVAMMNYTSNQLSEMVPVGRLYSELGRYQTAGATNFLLVNTSDFRPVVMGAKAVLSFGWTGSAGGSGDDFLRSWATSEFGPQTADDFLPVIKAYYTAPAIKPAGGGDQKSEIHEYGDMIYHYEARELLMIAMLDRPLMFWEGQAPPWRSPRLMFDGKDAQWSEATLKREAVACAEAEPRWDAVWKQAQTLAAKVSPGRRDFYQAQILTMIAIQRESNKMLLEVVRGLQDIKAGDRSAGKAHFVGARAALNRLKAEEAKAEYGKWKDWYNGDWLTGVNRTIAMVDLAIRWAEDPKHTPLPEGVVSNDWEAYTHIMQYQHGRTVDLN